MCAYSNSMVSLRALIWLYQSMNKIKGEQQHVLESWSLDNGYGHTNVTIIEMNYILLIEVDVLFTMIGPHEIIPRPIKELV